MAEERNYIGEAGETGEGTLSTDGFSDKSSLVEASRKEELDVDGDTEAEETEQIKDQIEETRVQMGETIDAIQERLSFSNLSEQVSEHVTNAVETAKDAVYAATLGRAVTIMKDIGNELSGSSIVKTARNNPLPFILIGAGAGLLAYQSLSGKKNNGTRRKLSDDAQYRVKSLASAETKISSGDSMDGVAGKVADAASSAYEKVSGAAGSVVSGAGEAVSSVYGSVGSIGSAARDQYDTYIEDNPLAVGAVALALGAAVGMAIPSTRYEGELLGNARGEIIERAQNTATDMIDKTKEAITDAGKNFIEKTAPST